ncbi:MAG: hypothetical protein ABSB49_09790 [Polyangia bacterium]
MRTLDAIRNRLAALSGCVPARDDGTGNSEQMGVRAAALLAEVDPAAEAQPFNPGECTAEELALIERAERMVDQMFAQGTFGPAVTP